MRFHSFLNQLYHQLLFLSISQQVNNDEHLFIPSRQERYSLPSPPPYLLSQIRSIRLIVLPPLHTITIRTNECGGEVPLPPLSSLYLSLSLQFLTVHSLLSPHDPYRARRLRPIWETLIPLHATGHHVAVPFTLTLTAPFTVHRYVPPPSPSYRNLFHSGS